MFNADSAKSTVMTHVGTIGEAEKHLSENHVDIVLLDLGLPDAQGVEAVRRAQAVAPEVPLVVLSGMEDEDLAVKALHDGAQGYLIKGRSIREACYGRYATQLNAKASNRPPLR